VSHETVLPWRITIDNSIDAHSPWSIAQDQDNDQTTAWIALEDEARPPISSTVVPHGVSCLDER